MKLNNQVKVGLATVICLLGQGYVLTYVLGIEPSPFIPFVPLIPYVVYIYARNKRTWYYNKPNYWIAAIVAVTLLDLAPFLSQAKTSFV